MNALPSRSWVACVAAWLTLSFLAWGQSPPNTLPGRIQATRVQVPNAVVQASSRVPATPVGEEPIPLKSASEVSSNRMSAPRSPWSTTLSTMFSLSIVVFLFFGAAMILRKSQPKQFQKLPKDVVEVLGRTAIAPRQNLILMRFGSKLILVSQQPGETRSIGEIQDANEVDRLLGLCESSKPESVSNSFREVFRQVAHAKPVRQG